MVKIHLASTKLSFVFFQRLEVHSECTPRTTKVLEATMLDMAGKHKEKCKQETIIFGLCETSINLGSVCT
jgi:hypothetical protein